MTREDILRMAREAELHCHMKLTEHGLVVEDLEHFAALVAAAQRKPLTDEEIDQIAIKCLDAPEPGWNRNLARAIERAHGIGGSDE